MPTKSQQKSEVMSSGNDGGVWHAGNRLGRGCSFRSLAICNVDSDDEVGSGGVVTMAKWCAYESLSRRTMVSLVAGLFAFFATFISASIYMPIEPSSAAETVTPFTTVNNEPSISVSASTVDFGRISKIYGERVIRTASNTVIVNAPLYGYELYISTSDNSNNLVRYGTAGTSEMEIISAAPTISTANPTILGDDMWGFAVKKRNATVGSGSEDVPASADFDISYPTGDDSDPDSRFSAVPTQDNQILIAERSTNAENVPTDVYYGVSIKDASVGIYRGTITYTAIGKEPTMHTVTVKLVPNFSKITIGDTECNTSNSIDSTDEGDLEGTKRCEAILTYGYSYNLEATPAEGYKFKEWNLSNGIGAFSDSNMASTAFTAGQGNTTIIPAVKTRQTITLNPNGATVNGSESAIATHGETMLSAITNPTRSYNISGFDTSYNNAADAMVTFQTTGDCLGATNCSSNYTLDGWYEEAAATNKVASNAATPVLQANTSYTNADSEWTSTSDQTLYAGWTSQAVTLPTIEKTGHTCGWTTGTSTSTITYNSGDAFTPTTDTVLHGVCTPIAYTQTTQIRYQNANDTWTDYTTVDTQDVNYGESYSWSTSQISDFNSTMYQAASVASYTVTGAKTNQVSIYRNTFSCYIQYRLQNADGSYGSYSVGTNSTLRYGQACSWSRAADTTYKAASYSVASVMSNVSHNVNVDRNTFTCYIQYRLQNADGGYGSYSTGTNSTLRYGQTCSWSRAADATYKAANYSITSIVANVSQSINVDRNTYICSKRYRLQDQNGNYPSSYTSVAGESLRYGQTCDYSQSYTDYQTKSTSGTMNGDITLSLDLPRNVYSLIINSNATYISSVSGAGTYRWEQTVNISATVASSSRFSGWSLSSGTAGTFGDTSSASTTFTMGKGNATIYANGQSSGSSSGGGNKPCYKTDANGNKVCIKSRCPSVCK